MARPQVLIVEDDLELSGLLKRGLDEEGFDVRAVATGGDLLAAAQTEEPDVFIIDVGLPDTDGRDLCQALRAQGINTPVLFLTARDALTDRLSGFSAGGDDYVTKPFALNEVIARLQALLRRSQFDPTVAVGDLRLDPVAHAAVSGAARVELTPTEFRLLAALAASPGDVVRRRELIKAAWPDGAIVHDNTLDVYMARVRRKLKQLDGELVVATAHGVGYRLQ
jgi:two-component system, OmpR family, response regulator